MNDSSVLDVSGLHLAYHQQPVVRDLALHVMPGEVVALLGPNGAGKSTLMAGLTGLLQPVDGDIVVDGRRINGMGPRAIAGVGVTLVPERRACFDGLTVAEHVRLLRRDWRRAWGRSLRFSRACSICLIGWSEPCQGGSGRWWLLAVHWFSTLVCSCWTS